MSTSETAARPDGPRVELLMIGAVAIAGLALLLYLSAQRQTVLRKSAVGFEGLQIWLTSQGIDARSFTGGWTIDPETVGLLMQPLYDTRLSQRRDRPETQEELLFQQDEVDHTLSEILDKRVVMSREPGGISLIVLPKWRSGVRLTGLAHPVLLDDPDALTETLRSVVVDDAAQLVPATTPFVSVPYVAGPDDTGTGPLEATLYAPQLFRSRACRPIIGSDEAMLMGYCGAAGHRSAYVLSDPDLFNNHGLRLGDNAAIAAHFFRDYAAPLGTQDAARSVVIDYSTLNWLSAGTDGGAGDDYERSWADFQRFFAPPFLALWLAGAFVLALVLWRAGLRNTPLSAGPRGPGSAEALAIRARARLMRLTDHDGALVGDYAEARLAALGTALFGPANGLDADRLQRQIAAAFPGERTALERALSDIRALPPQTRATEAVTHVNALETILEKLSHEPR